MTESTHTKVLAVIPARHASTRFPGKPLAPIAGRPMIQHVVERVRQARTVSRILVATDEEKIKATVEGFGGEAILTRRDHPNGTERVAEVAVHVSADIYVNVQGDEPLINPETIDAVVSAMIEDEAMLIATPCIAISHQNDIMDPNVVKVVRDFDANALYFSRAPIPWVRNADDTLGPLHMKHLGLYAYRREALLEYATLPPGALERVEQLEQLRWLENGFRIGVVETDFDAVSVDVPADIKRVEQLLNASGAA